MPPLLRDTEFRRYWSASTVSMVGDQVTTIAVPLTAVLALHAGAAVMGLLTALQWLPSLLFGVHAGAFADRRGRRRQLMIACDLGRSALLVTVPVCYAFGVLTIGQLLAVVFAAGSLSILFNVADATLFVSIVKPGPTRFPSSGRRSSCGGSTPSNRLPTPAAAGCSRG